MSNDDWDKIKWKNWNNREKALFVFVWICIIIMCGYFLSLVIRSLNFIK